MYVELLSLHFFRKIGKTLADIPILNNTVFMEAYNFPLKTNFTKKSAEKITF